MQILLDIIAPVFGIVALGYGAARLGWFSAQATDGVGAFVFNFAIPALLFRSMARMVFPDEIDWGFLVAYFGGGYLAWAAAMAVSALVFRRDTATAAVAGMGGAFGNTVLLGIPLVLTTYGDAGALPVFLIVSFHSWQLFTVVTVLIEGGRGNRARLRDLPRSILGALVRNPILMGVLGGLLWNAADLSLPRFADGILETLGQAALPCAIFTMGASLATFRLRGALAEAGSMVACKLLLHPAAVFVLGTWVFELQPLWRDTAVIVAAMPTGINVYLFAQRYDAGVAPVATAMLMATALSVVTVSLLLHGLGVR
ncbi:MAG: AEC family transporter [Hyphomicrobiales bacterium]|nr:AEC family transporter [Hyphomicrobiales bacterium]MCP5374247.1 AEC family transporter [Hyphomicrobiales bacterium]